MVKTWHELYILKEPQFTLSVTKNYSEIWLIDGKFGLDFIILKSEITTKRFMHDSFFSTLMWRIVESFAISIIKQFMHNSFGNLESLNSIITRFVLWYLDEEDSGII